MERRWILPSIIVMACDISMSVTLNLKMLDINYYINDVSSDGHFWHAQWKSISSAQAILQRQSIS